MRPGTGGGGRRWRLLLFALLPLRLPLSNKGFAFMLFEDAEALFTLLESNGPPPLPLPLPLPATDMRRLMIPAGSAASPPPPLKGDDAPPLFADAADPSASPEPPASASVALWRAAAALPASSGWSCSAKERTGSAPAARSGPPTSAVRGVFSTSKCHFTTRKSHAVRAPSKGKWCLIARRSRTEGPPRVATKWSKRSCTTAKSQWATATSIIVRPACCCCW